MLDVMEMECIRNVCGVTRIDRGIEEVWHRVGVREKISDGVDRKVLKRFRHVELRSGSGRLKEC